MGNPERAEPVVIGLAGHKGSGKSTLAAALARHLDAAIASFGAYVRQEASMVEPLALADFGAALLSRVGPERFLDATISSAAWDGVGSLIIEGVRHRSILDALRRRFPQALVVFVTAAEGERAARLTHRDAVDAEVFRQLAQHSTEREVSDLAADADSIVDGTLDVERIAGEIAAWVRGGNR